ncbi:hypothetical protein [uncultured Actinomyces sp.]|uniref:hypothetical protein n=1 Tax=uncultured Actinomyces sp. TaxID=249061 RepID=UPI00260F1518|nr:hypothetical protein [uncultured Actinomyces sp.]
MSSAAVGAQTPVLTVCSQADPRRVVASVVIDVILLAAPGVLAYVLPGPAVVRLALVLCTVVTVVVTGYAHMLHGRAAGGALLGLRTVDRSAGLPTGTYEALITPLRGGRSAHAVTLSTRPGPDPVRGTLATLGHTTSPQPVSQPPAAPTPEVASTPLSASSAPLPPEAPAPSPGPGARLSSDTAIRPLGPAARLSSDTAIRPLGPAARPSSDSDTAVRPGAIPAQPGHAPAPPPSRSAGTGAGRAPSPTAPASPASPTGAPASGDSPASPAGSPATPTTGTPAAPAGTSSSHPPVTLVRASAPTRVSVMPSGSATKRPGAPTSPATKRPGAPTSPATIPTRTSVMPGTSRTSAPPPGPTAPAHSAPRPAPAPPPAPVQVTITSLPVPAPADDSATSLPPLVVTGAAITPSPVAPPPPSSPPPPAASAPPSAAPASPSSPATSSPSVPRRSTRALLSEAGPRARATADVDTLRRPPREDPAATSVRMEPLALPTPTSPSPLPASPTPRAPSPTTSPNAPAPSLSPPATRRAGLSPSTASLPRQDPQSTLTSLPAPTSPAANRHAQPPASRSRSRAQSPARHAATPEPAEPVIPPAPTPAEWRIRMVDDNGWQAVITRPTILGRALRRRSGGADTALLTVPDTSESASKEHAMLNIHNHLLVVTDLGSAKGTTIRMRDGRTYPCTAHQPVATPLPSVISLGGYQLSLTEE